MRRWQLKGLTVIIVAIMLTMVPLAGMAMEVTTIEREINDNYQIVSSDGQVYEVAENPEGNDLVENHIAKKVKVTGTVTQEGELIIITVASFQIMEE